MQNLKAVPDPSRQDNLINTLPDLRDVLHATQTRYSLPTGRLKFTFCWHIKHAHITKEYFFRSTFIVDPL